MIDSNKDSLKIQKEIINKILMEEDVVLSIKKNIKDLIEIIPEIKNMIGFEHKHPHHHLNVWAHTLYALSFAPNNFDIRLTLLLHDIGKPLCYQEGNDGVRHFKGHPLMSRIIGKSILERLNFDDDFIYEICDLIEKHDTPLSKQEILIEPDITYKRFMVQKCDALAHNPEKNAKRLAYIQTMEQIFYQVKNKEEN